MASCAVTVACELWNRENEKHKKWICAFAKFQGSKTLVRFTLVKRRGFTVVTWGFLAVVKRWEFYRSVVIDCSRRHTVKDAERVWCGDEWWREDCDWSTDGRSWYSDYTKTTDEDQVGCLWRPVHYLHMWVSRWVTLLIWQVLCHRRIPVFILYFYPRDAMLVRVIAIATCLSVCLSVCHAPVLCQNKES